MLYVILIGLCLALVGVAGFQFMYMFYLDRLDRERKKRLVELEHRCKDLSSRLIAAENKIANQDEIIEGFDIYNGYGEEVWADVLEESQPTYLNSTSVAPQPPENSSPDLNSFTNSVSLKTFRVISRWTPIPLP